MNNLKDKKLKKLINSKFLYTLPLTGIGLLGTHQTTHAMFQNPRLSMPLVKSGNGKPICFPKTYTDNDNPVSYTTKTGALFKNPVLGMPLVKTINNRPVFLSENDPTSYIIESNVVYSGTKNRFPTPPSSPTTINVQNSLTNFGDDLNTTTTSTNVGNLGNSLRNAGDRFNQ